jgi:hypothetical protein
MKIDVKSRFEAGTPVAQRLTPVLNPVQLFTTAPIGLIRAKKLKADLILAYT